MVPIALLAAGCAEEPEPILAPPTVPTAVSISPEARISTSAAPFVAADGRNLKTCGDGTCEVIVKTGDQLPNDGGAGPLSVMVQAGKVGLAPASGGMAGSVSGQPGMVHQINRQLILIVAVQNDEGILRLSKK